MSRPAHSQPTPGELEVLKVLWEQGPATVREVLQRLSPERPRAYTSVMSLLSVMADKGLVTRSPRGRAFVYAAAAEREQTLAGMVGDLLGRAFEGSAQSLVARLLEESQPSEDELRDIRRTIDQYLRERGG